MDEIEDVISFWADLGVDGFRLDAFNNCDKDQSFPDVETAPGEKYGFASQHYVSRPGVDKTIHELYKRQLGPKNLVTVVELAYCPTQKAIDYCDPAREEFDMPYFFDMLNFDQDGWDKFKPTGFHVKDLKAVLGHWIKELRGVGKIALFIGNHDQCRALNRFGDTGAYRQRSAKTLANAVYFVEGVPYIYQGDEIGMTNTDYESIDEYNDVEVHNYWNEHVVENKEDPAKVLEILRERSRDAGRSPIAWNDSENGGFTTGKPWLKVGSEYKTVNVAAQENDPDSVLNFYRELIKVRHGRRCIVDGDTLWIDMESDEHMSYVRTYEDEVLVSLNNFTDKEVTVELPGCVDPDKLKVVLHNCDAPILGRSVVLRPWECITAVN